MKRRKKRKYKPKPRTDEQISAYESYRREHPYIVPHFSDFRPDPKPSNPLTLPVVASFAYENGTITYQ